MIRGSFLGMKLAPVTVTPIRFFSCIAVVTSKMWVHVQWPLDM